MVHIDVESNLQLLNQYRYYKHKGDYQRTMLSYNIHMRHGSEYTLQSVRTNTHIKFFILFPVKTVTYRYLQPT